MTCYACARAQQQDQQLHEQMQLKQQRILEAACEKLRRWCADVCCWGSIPSCCASSHTVTLTVTTCRRVQKPGRAVSAAGDARREQSQDTELASIPGIAAAEANSP
jgi:hypothetical protein